MRKRMQDEDEDEDEDDVSRCRSHVVDLSALRHSRPTSDAKIAPSLPRLPHTAGWAPNSPQSDSDSALGSI